MNLALINKIAYKASCVIFAVFLLLGSLGMYSNHLFVKGAIGLVSCVAEVMLFFRLPKFTNWLQVVCVLLIAMYIGGVLSRMAQ